MKNTLWAVLALAIISLSGCAAGGYNNGIGPYGKTLGGAALGGAAGGLVGSAAGNSAAATAAGVLLGTAAGAYMGNQLDQTDQRQQANEAHYRRLEQGQQAPARQNCYKSYDRNNRPITVCPDN